MGAVPVPGVRLRGRRRIPIPDHLRSSGVAGVQELQNGTTDAGLWIVIRRFKVMKEFYSAGSWLEAISGPGNGYPPPSPGLLTPETPVFGAHTAPHSSPK